MDTSAPKARPITLAEMREWLRISHKEDDAAIQRCLDAAQSEYCQTTGRTSADITDAEAVAIMQRAAGLFKYRGDDTVAADTSVFDAMRSQFNTNQLG